MAQAMNEYLEKRKWTLRQAGIATGVSYTTIDRISKGQNVNADQIARFAYKISEPGRHYETVLHWLKLAKKDDFVSILSAVTATAQRVPDEAKTRVELANGREVFVLPSGREVEATPENIALIETMFGALEKAKQHLQ